MAQLQIIRASAGAGKTYRLTQEVILLLLKEPLDYYRRILAVTFTNKATTEMKERILSELDNLGNGKESDHLEKIIEILKISEEKIRNKARAILLSILHGYSWFRVETIDSFFQGIIRAFIRELNIAGYYSIELNQERILKLAIDNLLNRASDDKALLNWLLDYISQKQDEGKAWSINKELEDLGRTIFSENLSQKLPEIKSIIENKEFLGLYKNTLESICSTFERNITTIAKEVLDKMKMAGLTEKDFFYSSTGPVGQFNKYLDNDYSSPNTRVQKVLDDPGKYGAASSSQKEAANAFGINTMTPALHTIAGIIEKDFEDYSTAKTILKNLHIFGVLSALNNEIQNVREQEGVFLLSDAAPFIQRIINENDTPFIYEKTGNQFNHLLIDEFQDTSNMQWDNFKPLISNSLSRDKDCLLVGDIKQSIYRWRNSNWEILANQVKIDFKEPSILKETILETNWRSDGNIISFNNHFFNLAADFLAGQVDIKDKLNANELYADTKQLIPSGRKKDKGFINIKLFSKEEVRENKEGYWNNELIDQINSFLKIGYQPGQIALLVRTRKEGTALANYLIDANTKSLFKCELSIISNESLLLNNSAAIKLIISALRFINNPNEKLFAAEIIYNYHLLKNSDSNIFKVTSTGLFETELLNTEIQPGFAETCQQLKGDSLLVAIEKLTVIFKLYESESELVYIHSFLDIVYDYTTQNLADINRFLDYWEEEGITKAISTAEANDSIRIYTIHKSKGLEFPVVILPFAEWSLSPKPGSKIWVTPEKEPYSKLGYLPVNLSNDLEDTIFSHDLINEKYLNQIDNINLLYVAFTRAKNALVVFSAINGGNNITTNNLITNTLDQIPKDKLNLIFLENENRYIFGSISSPLKKEDLITSEKVTPEQPNLNLPEVRFQGRAEKFLTDTNAISIGKTLHAVMEEIISINDINRVLKHKTEEGILEKEQAASIEKILHKATTNSEALSWFDGSYTVLTENDIILPNHQIKRPDRIMLKENQAIVVDYKFGLDEDFNKHKKQVKEYMQLLTDSGISKVTGYVWYLLDENLVEV